MTQTTTAEQSIRRGALTRYLVAAALARIADEGARVSLVLLALDESGSAAVGGAMVAGLLVPHVLAAPLVGLAVDRAPRPGRVLAGMTLVFAGSLLSVAVLLGHAPLGVVMVILLVGGCCGPAITGGLTSRVPSLVGTQRVPRAFGLDSLFYNVASMAGPAVAGIVAAAASPVVAQGVLAASAALGAAGIAGLPLAAGTRGSPAPPPIPQPGWLAGVREILRQRTLRVVTIASAVGQLGPGALVVVAAVLAQSLGRPAAGGLLLTAVAAGALIGSLVWTAHPLAADCSALVTTVSMIGIGVPIGVGAVTRSLVVVAVLFAVSGFFVGPFGSALFTTRTRFAAEAVRTQVFTIGAGLKVTASAVGAALAGLLADRPPPLLLLVVASSPLLAGMVGTVALVAAPRGVPQAPAGPAGGPPRRPRLAR